MSKNDDTISRRDAVNEIHKYFVEEINKTPTEIDEDGDELYVDMPTVNSLFMCNKELSKRIKLLPSADKPEKWECKDCTHWDKLDYEAPRQGWCDQFEDWTDADEYCSRCAKMRGEEE